MGPSNLRRPHLGRVTFFDGDRGLGVVADEGGRELGFHCVEIADGSRRIEVGTEVVFTVRRGHRGEVEAAGLVPRPGPTER